jgi:hypothetical protein
MPQRNKLPVLTVISNGVVFAVINVFQLVFNTPIQYIYRKTFGYDYGDFYYASLSVFRGQSPYSVVRYVTPPLPAILNMVFVPLGFEKARNIFTLLVSLAIFVSYVLIYRAFQDTSTNDNTILLLSGILLIVFSYPFYFLLARGNIDSLILLGMISGLLLLPKRVQIGSLLLAIAILCKLYPLLILSYLFFTRRWKPFFWTCGWVILIALLLLPFWDDYIAASYHRLYFFRLDENGSLANTIMILMIFVKLLFTGTIAFDFSQYSSMAAAVLYGTMVIVLLYSDYKLAPTTTPKEHLANALLYFPFMVAIPQLVYHYEFIILIPLLPVLSYLWNKHPTHPVKSGLILSAIGLALSQWQAIALYLVTNNMFAQYIPGFGLMLILTGVSLYKLLQLKEHIMLDGQAVSV